MIKKRWQFKEEVGLFSVVALTTSVLVSRLRWAVVRKVLRATGAVICAGVFTMGLMLAAAGMTVSRGEVLEIVGHTSAEDFVFYGEEVEMSVDPVVEAWLFEVPEVQELARRVGDDAVRYLLYGEAISAVTDEEIERIVGSRFYYEELGVEMNEEELGRFREELGVMLAGSMEGFLKEMGEIRENLDEDWLWRAVFSEMFVMGAFAVSGVAVVLIGLLRWSLWRRTTVWVGVSLILTGVLVVVIGAMIGELVMFDITHEVAGEVAVGMVSRWSTFGLMYAAIGVFMMTVYYVVCNMIRERNLLMGRGE